MNSILRHKRLDAPYYAVEHLETEATIRRASQHVSFEALGSFARLWSGPFGSKLPSSLYRSVGPYPLYRSQNVKAFWIQRDGLVYLDAKAYSELKSCSAEMGDILVSKAGFVGTACIVGRDEGPAIITEHVLGVRPLDDTDQYFLLATLNSTICRRQLEREGLGTILDYLGVEVSRELLVPRPKRPLQVAIGNKVRAAERLREEAELSRGALYDWLNSILPEWEAPAEKMTVSPIFFHDLSHERLDAWFNHPRFRQLEQLLESWGNLIPLAEVVSLVEDRWPGGSGEIEYIEIGEFDLSQGTVHGTIINGGAAPSRAQILAMSGDIAVSLVRPNRKNVAFIQGSGTRPIVVTSGCEVLRCADPSAAALYSVVLRHNAVTYQIMRWNTGTNYPAIENLRLERIFIPAIREVEREQLLRAAEIAVTGQERANALIAAAITDVEKLIEGNLDEATCLDEGRKLADEFGLERP
jgi:type I restriction enzyme S subunit